MNYLCLILLVFMIHTKAAAEELSVSVLVKKLESFNHMRSLWRPA